MHMTLVRSLAVLSLMLGTSAWAVGPGIPQFEEGKGTIGIVCTNGQGVSYAPATFATPTNQRNLVQREYALCLGDVLGQWESEGNYNELFRNVTTYVDGWSEYQGEFISMRTRAMMSRSGRRSSAR